MIKTYSAIIPELKPAEFDDAALLSIGKLIRVVAEIESRVTLYVCRLFDLTEGKAAILLAQMGISQRIQLAKKGADAKGSGEPELYREVFEHESFKMIIAARNAAAHGVLIGRTPDGKYALRILKSIEVKTGALTTEVVLYDASMFAQHADITIMGLAGLPSNLKIEALLETRRKQPLGPHPKAPPQKKRSGRESFPPQS